MATSEVGRTAPDVVELGVMHAEAAGAKAASGSEQSTYSLSIPTLSCISMPYIHCATHQIPHFHLLAVEKWYPSGAVSPKAAVLLERAQGAPTSATDRSICHSDKERFARFRSKTICLCNEQEMDPRRSSIRSNSRLKSGETSEVAWCTSQCALRSGM